MKIEKTLKTGDNEVIWLNDKQNIEKGDSDTK